MARLLAALRVLANRPDQPALTADEIDRLGALHPDETRRQLHGSLRRIESFLRPLERMGGAGTPAGAVDLTCLIADSDGRNAQGELLKDLIVQWLIRQVGRSGVTSGSLVLVGADEVGHRHLERLSTLCERRGIRLVLLFSHLRKTRCRRSVAARWDFMRLGNHTEAQQAAEFIGRKHTLSRSPMTRPGTRAYGSRSRSADAQSRPGRAVLADPHARRQRAVGTAYAPGALLADLRADLRPRPAGRP